MTGMLAGTPPLRSGWTAWKKSGRRRKSSMTFSVDSLQNLAKWGCCRRISTGSCSTGLWITQRSIRSAGWYSPSAMAQKVAQEYKESSGQVSGISGYPARLFLCMENACRIKCFFCMEICKDLRYNLHVMVLDELKLLIYKI